MLPRQDPSMLGTHLLPMRRGRPPLLSLPMGTLEERGS